MIFADKLIALRKKAGWSQEELAQQLNVSRQSVSKWEGAQSVPDLDKIVQLSRVFGVSTDYLLKDELEEQEPAPSLPEQPQRRRVSMEEASRYLELRCAAAPRLALATFLCVISPIALILLGAPATLSTSVLSDVTVFGLSLFDLYDFLSSNLMLPLDGLLLSLFVGYVWSRSDALDALTNGGTLHNLACAKAILFLCRYVTPILIVIILLNGLKVF